VSAVTTVTDCYDNACEHGASAVPSDALDQFRPDGRTLGSKVGFVAPRRTSWRSCATRSRPLRLTTLARDLDRPEYA
jgi:hypothetical protein